LWKNNIVRQAAAAMAAVNFVDIFWLADMLLPSHDPPLVVSLLSRYIV